jgi:hypothetical protein
MCHAGIVTATLTAAGSDDRVENDADLLRAPPVPPDVIRHAVQVAETPRRLKRKRG